VHIAAGQASPPGRTVLLNSAYGPIAAAPKYGRRTLFTT
jgi:hypothetical protein